MNSQESHVYFWFRRDLRVHDNHALFQALSSGKTVIPVFIFDTEILNDLPKMDKRVNFIYDHILALKKRFLEFQSDIVIAYGTVEESWNSIFSQFGKGDVYCNEDYEPYAINRDLKIKIFLESQQQVFHSFKDQIIASPKENLKAHHTPYTVFTPYHKNWLTQYSAKTIPHYDSENHLNYLKKFKTDSTISLEKMGFLNTEYDTVSLEFPIKIIQEYTQNRDIPSIDGTSKLSVHLRFGTVSIRDCYKMGFTHSEKWLAELNWREFYMQILFHFPHVIGNSFKPNYDFIQWRNNEQEFEAWKVGKTGYPIVDAGMRELNETGFMHNRVRMIVASFLTKHLLIDWRWGEAYFAEKLMDFELSSNNGGWQWAAGSGVDAAPYFRIFNPYLQTLKFDPQMQYIQKWIPEFNSLKYPSPIVVHEYARKRCLEAYSNALKPQ